jgi:hypothetical protein
MEPILDGSPRHARGRGRAAIVAALVVLALGFAGLWLWQYRRSTRHEGHAGQASATTYYCPMHPHYRSDKPGNCPICSMKLVPLEGAGSPAAQPAAAAASPPSGETGTPAAAAPAGAPRVRIAPERQQQIGVKFAEAARVPRWRSGRWVESPTTRGRSPTSTRR